MWKLGTRFITVMALLIASPSYGSSIPCADRLSSFSLEKVLEDYAHLVLAAQETPTDSPLSVLLKSAVMEKAAQLETLIPSTERSAAKLKLTELLASQLQNKRETNEAAMSQEIESRQNEQNIMTLQYGPFVEKGKGETFNTGELSPDGNWFLGTINKGQSEYDISVYSLINGSKVFSKKIKSLYPPQSLFVSGGKILKIQYNSKPNFNSFPLAELFKARTVEFFDFTSGHQFSKKLILEFLPGYYPTGSSISSNGSRILIAKKWGIKIFDLLSNKKWVLPIRPRSLINADFDLSGKNILFSYYADGAVPAFASQNIETKKINWSKTGRSSLSKNKKYVFLGQDDTVSRPGFLLDAASGEVIRIFHEKSLNFSNAIVSDDSKFIFLPDGNGKKGYIYSVEDNEPGVTIKIPDGSYFGSRFFDNNQKFAAVISNKQYIWSTASGAPFSLLPQTLANLFAFGVDDEGNVIGAMPSESGQLYKNLQIWPQKSD